MSFKVKKINHRIDEIFKNKFLIFLISVFLSIFFLGEELALMI